MDTGLPRKVRELAPAMGPLSWLELPASWASWASPLLFRFVTVVKDGTVMSPSIWKYTRAAASSATLCSRHIHTLGNLHFLIQDSVPGRHSLWTSPDLRHPLCQCSSRPSSVVPWAFFSDGSTLAAWHLHCGPCWCGHGCLENEPWFTPGLCMLQVGAGPHTTFRADPMTAKA